jgi:excisionase family DNA binding protein
MTSTTPAATAASPRRLMTRKQAATYLNVSVRKVDQMSANGELRRVKIDACVRFDPADLDAAIEARKEVIK